MRKGQVFPLVAVALIALVAMVSLSVDLGLLFTARSEAQRGADAIALAAASAYIANSPANYASDAKLRGKAIAAQNFVRTDHIDTVTVTESTYYWESSEVVLQVIVDSLKVRAHVRRQGLPLWFASLLGRNFGRIGATAAARAVEAGVNSCMVPFAIPVDPDDELELGESLTLKSADDPIVPGVDPFFAPFSMPVDPAVAPFCPRATGLEEEAWGRLDVCSSCDPGNGRFPWAGYGGWHQTSDVDGWLDWTSGDPIPSEGIYPGDGYAENVCGNNCGPISVGERIPIITGDMDGPTAWGVNARLALDPQVSWDPIGQQVMRGVEALESYESSSRVIKLPTFDPADPDFDHPSDRAFNVTGFAYFLLEEGPQHGFYDPTDQLEISGRFLFYAPGNVGGGGTGPYSRVLRLVE